MGGRVLPAIARFWRDTRGVSALEFALILPMLTGLICGTTEIGHLMLLTQRIQNGAFILADLAGRDETLCAEQVDDIFFAMDDLLKPFQFRTEGMAVITSISGIDPAANGNTTEINWQRVGGSDLSEVSDVGTEVGEAAILPATLALNPGDPLVVAEMFYRYEPLFGLFSSEKTVHKIAYIKPRLGTLALLPPCS